MSCVSPANVTLVIQRGPRVRTMRATKTKRRRKPMMMAMMSKTEMTWTRARWWRKWTSTRSKLAYIPKQMAFTLTPIHSGSSTSSSSSSSSSAVEANKHSLHVLLAPSKRATWSQMFKDTIASGMQCLEKENIEVFTSSHSTAPHVHIRNIKIANIPSIPCRRARPYRWTTSSIWAWSTPTRRYVSMLRITK